MSKKKRGASRSRRCDELWKAASLLRESRPDLADKLINQARFLSAPSSGPLADKGDLPALYGEMRATSRDELVEAGKALVESQPAMAHLLFSQAAALVTSNKLRGQIAALASNARRRAEQSLATARRSAAASRQPSSPSEE